MYNEICSQSGLSAYEKNIHVCDIYSTLRTIVEVNNKYFGLGPFKSMVLNPSRAIFRSSDYGPTFGGGHDIRISDTPNSNSNSFSNVGAYNDYAVPSGVQHPPTLLAGDQSFQLNEIEVFYIG